MGAWQGLVDGVMCEWDRTGRGYDPPGAAGLSVAVLSTRLRTSRRCRTSASSQAGKEEARVCGEAGGGSCRRMSHRDSVWRVPAVRERAGRMPDTKVPLDRPSASGDADPTRMFASRSRAREWWQGRTRRERVVCVAGWCGEGVSVWQVEAALH